MELFLILGILVVIIVVFLLKIWKNKNHQTQDSLSLNILQSKCKKQAEILCPIQIYYGSQQGTAVKLSKILAQEGLEFGFQTSVIDLAETNFNEELVEGKVGIFLVATHGEGEPTDNAKAYMNWLAEEQSKLKGYRFVVFGLGNTQYEHYNKVGKLLNQNLEKQGAIRIYNYGEGDDNQSLEEDFNQWKENIWTQLKVALSDLIDKDKLIEEDKDQQPLLEKRKSSVNLANNFGKNQSLCKLDYILEVTQARPLDLNHIPEELVKLNYEFQTKAFLKAKCL